MHIFRYIILLSIVLSLSAFPQIKDSVLIAGNYKIKIDSIKVKGNNKTKDFIILRELNFKEGDTLTTSKAEYNRDRVYSLSLFGIVEILPYQFSDHITAYVVVEESWYIWPIPFITIKDKDWKKLSYGMDLEIKNLLGYNERLRANVSLGYDPSYYLSYSNPVIDPSNKLLFTSELSYSKVKNKSKEADSLIHHQFDQKVISGMIGIGNRLSLYQYLNVSMGLTYTETPFYFTRISASGQRIDRTFFVGVGYSYDTRDLVQFPKKGLYFSSALSLKGLGINNINYQVINMDIRGYKELFHDLFGKLRFTTRNTSGSTIPYYDYSYLGYGERVRGNSNNIREGENYFLFSAETYMPIIKDIRISFEWIPIIPKELLIYRVALYVQAFGDAGLVYNYSERVNFNRIQRGYGAGLTLLILPYNLLRIEYAINEFRNSELLVDLGISF